MASITYIPEGATHEQTTHFDASPGHEIWQFVSQKDGLITVFESKKLPSNKDVWSGAAETPLDSDGCSLKSEYNPKPLLTAKGKLVRASF